MVTRAAFDLHRLLGLVAFSPPCFAIDELHFSGGGGRVLCAPSPFGGQLPERQKDPQLSPCRAGRWATPAAHAQRRPHKPGNLGVPRGPDTEGGSGSPRGGRGPRGHHAHAAARRPQPGGLGTVRRTCH